MMRVGKKLSTNVFMDTIQEQTFLTFINKSTFFFVFLFQFLKKISFFSHQKKIRLYSSFNYISKNYRMIVQKEIVKFFYKLFFFFEKKNFFSLSLCIDKNKNSNKLESKFTHVFTLCFVFDIRKQKKLLMCFLCVSVCFFK